MKKKVGESNKCAKLSRARKSEEYRPYSTAIMNKLLRDLHVT